MEQNLNSGCLFKKGIVRVISSDPIPIITVLKLCTLKYELYINVMKLLTLNWGSCAFLHIWTIRVQHFNTRIPTISSKFLIIKEKRGLKVLLWIGHCHFYMKGHYKIMLKVILKLDFQVLAIVFFSEFGNFFACVKTILKSLIIPFLKKWIVIHELIDLKSPDSEIYVVLILNTHPFQYSTTSKQM